MTSREAYTSRAGLSGGLLFFLLAIVTPLYLTFQAGSAVPWPAPLFLLFVLYGACRLTSIYISSRPRLMALGYSAYVYLFFGLAPFQQIIADKYAGRFHPTSDNIVRSALIIAVGVIAWEAAYSWRSNRTSPSSFLHVEIDRRRLRLLALLATSATLLFILVASPELFASREALYEKMSNVFGSAELGGVIAIAAGTIPVMAVLLCVFETWRKARLNLVMGITAFLLVVVSSNPISTPRFWLGPVGLGIVVSIGAAAGSIRRFRGVVLTLLLGLILVFPVAASFRYIDESSENATNQLFGLSEQLEGVDYDSFLQVTLGDAFVEDRGFQVGKQILGAALFAFPRDLWADKPEPTGQTLAKYENYSFTNLSSPLWIEGYVDFGYMGVAAYLGVLGALCSGLDKRYQIGVKAPYPSVWMAAVPLLAFYQFLLLRGSLLIAMPRLVAMIACFALVAKIVESKPIDADLREKVSTPSTKVANK